MQVSFEQLLATFQIKFLHQLNEISAIKFDKFQEALLYYDLHGDEKLFGYANTTFSRTDFLKQLYGTVFVQFPQLTEEIFENLLAHQLKSNQRPFSLALLQSFADESMTKLSLDGTSVQIAEIVKAEYKSPKIQEEFERERHQGTLEFYLRRLLLELLNQSYDELQEAAVWTPGAASVEQLNRHFRLITYYQQNFKELLDRQIFFKYVVSWKSFNVLKFQDIVDERIRKFSAKNSSISSDTIQSQFAQYRHFVDSKSQEEQYTFYKFAQSDQPQLQQVQCRASEALRLHQSELREVQVAGHRSVHLNPVSTDRGHAPDGLRENCADRDSEQVVAEVSDR